MVAKKRTNLRAKIQAKATQSSVAQSSDISIKDLPADPLAFLHTQKITKKDKLITKHENFISKVQNNNSGSTISKSSLRRRKRKSKEELLPKMQDLLTALDETAAEGTVNNDKPKSDKLKNVNIVKFVSKNPKNIPNPKNKSGVKLIESQARERFGSVLQDKSFKKSPFAALRENISSKLQNL